MKINLIFASDKNLAIGKGGKLPWKSRLELKHFMATTFGGIVITGRKTYESLPGPLKNRLTVVVSSKEVVDDTLPPYVKFVKSLADALEFAEQQYQASQVWVIGGGELYKAALPIADLIVHTTFTEFEVEEPDTWFPPYTRNPDWTRVDQYNVAGTCESNTFHVGYWVKDLGDGLTSTTSTKAWIRDIRNRAIITLSEEGNQEHCVTPGARKE